jgi:hypothetical protein
MLIFLRQDSEQLYKADGDSPHIHGRKSDGVSGDAWNFLLQKEGILFTRCCTIDLVAASIGDT